MSLINTSDNRNTTTLNKEIRYLSETHARKEEKHRYLRNISRCFSKPDACTKRAHVPIINKHYAKKIRACFSKNAVIRAEEQLTKLSAKRQKIARPSLSIYIRQVKRFVLESTKKFTESFKSTTSSGVQPLASQKEYIEKGIMKKTNFFETQLKIVYVENAQIGKTCYCADSLFCGHLNENKMIATQRSIYRKKNFVTQHKPTFRKFTKNNQPT